MKTIIAQLLRTMSSYEFKSKKNSKLHALMGMNIFLGLLLTGCHGDDDKESTPMLSQNLVTEISTLGSDMAVRVVEVMPDLASNSIGILLEVNDENVRMDVNMSSPLEVSSAIVYVHANAESQMVTEGMMSKLLAASDIIKQGNISIEDLQSLINMSPNMDMIGVVGVLTAAGVMDDQEKAIEYLQLTGDIDMQIAIFSEIVNKDLHTEEGCINDEMLEFLNVIVVNNKLGDLLSKIGEENYISIMAMSDKENCKIDGGNFEENYLVNAMSAALFNINDVAMTISTIKNADSQYQELLFHEFSELVLQSQVATSTQRSGDDVNFSPDVRNQTARLEFELHEDDEYIYVKSDGKEIQLKLADYIEENTDRWVNINFSGAVNYLQEGEDAKGIWEVIFVNKSDGTAEEEDFMGVLNEMVGFAYDPNGVKVSIFDVYGNEREADLQIYSTSIPSSTGSESDIVENRSDVAENTMISILTPYVEFDVDGGVSEADIVTGTGLAFYVLESMYNFADNIFDKAYQGDYEDNLVARLVNSIEILLDVQSDNEDMQSFFKKALGEYLTLNADSLGLPAAKTLIKYMTTLTNEGDEFLITGLSPGAKIKMLELLTATLDTTWPEGEKTITIDAEDELGTLSFWLQTDYPGLNKREESIDTQAAIQVMIECDLDDNGSSETYYINVFNSKYNSEDLIMIVDGDGNDYTQQFRDKDWVYTDSVVYSSNTSSAGEGTQYGLFQFSDDSVTVVAYDSGSNSRVYFSEEVDIKSATFQSPNIDGVIEGAVRVNQYKLPTLFADNAVEVLREIIDAGTYGEGNYQPDQQIMAILTLTANSISTGSIDAGVTQSFNIERHTGTFFSQLVTNISEIGDEYGEIVRASVWEYFKVNYLDQGNDLFYIVESYITASGIEVEDLMKLEEFRESESFYESYIIGSELQVSIANLFSQTDEEAIRTFYGHYASRLDQEMPNSSWLNRSDSDLETIFRGYLTGITSGDIYGSGVYSSVSAIEFIEYIVDEYSAVIDELEPSKKITIVQAVLVEVVGSDIFDDIHRYDSVIFEKLYHLVDDMISADELSGSASMNSLLTERAYDVLESSNGNALAAMLLFQGYYHNKESEADQDSFHEAIQDSIVLLIEHLNELGVLRDYLSLLEQVLVSYNNVGIVLDYKEITKALGPDFTLYQLKSEIELDVMLLIWNFKLGDSENAGSETVSIVDNVVYPGADLSMVELVRKSDFTQESGSVNSLSNNWLRLMKYEQGSDGGVTSEIVKELLIPSDDSLGNAEVNSSLYGYDSTLNLSWSVGELYESMFEVAEGDAGFPDIINPLIDGKSLGILQLAVLADSYEEGSEFFDGDLERFIEDEFLDVVSLVNRQVLEIAVRLHMQSFLSSDNFDDVVDAVIGESDMTTFLGSLTAEHDYLLPMLLVKLHQHVDGVYNDDNFDDSTYDVDAAAKKSLQIIDQLSKVIAKADPQSEGYVGSWGPYFATVISKEIVKLRQLDEDHEQSFLSVEMLSYIINSSLSTGSYDPSELITISSFDSSLYVYAMIKQSVDMNDTILPQDSQVIFDSFKSVVDSQFDMEDPNNIFNIFVNIFSPVICDSNIAKIYQEFIIIVQSLENEAGFYNYVFEVINESADEISLVNSISDVSFFLAR
jgi:hypothetical protein